MADIKIPFCVEVRGKFYVAEFQLPGVPPLAIASILACTAIRCPDLWQQWLEMVKNLAGKLAVEAVEATGRTIIHSEMSEFKETPKANLTPERN
jgi:hypothetical protein